MVAGGGDNNDDEQGEGPTRSWMLTKKGMTRDRSKRPSAYKRPPWLLPPAQSKDLHARRTYTPEGHHRDQNALTRFTVPVLWKVIERAATFVDILMYRDMLTLSPGA